MPWHVLWFLNHAGKRCGSGEDCFWYGVVQTAHYLDTLHFKLNCFGPKLLANVQNYSKLKNSSFWTVKPSRESRAAQVLLSECSNRVQTPPNTVSRKKIKKGSSYIRHKWPQLPDSPFPGGFLTAGDPHIETSSTEWKSPAEMFEFGCGSVPCIKIESYWDCHK